MPNSIATRLVELQQELNRDRERLAALDAELIRLAALDAERKHLLTHCLRLEGARAVLQEPWVQPLPVPEKDELILPDLFARNGQEPEDVVCQSP